MSFYLPHKVIDDLEDVWLKLRARNKGQKISKSLIVTQALERAIKQLRDKEL